MPPAAGSRYFYVPYVLFCWACITLLLSSRKHLDRGLAILLLVAVLRSSLISGFESTPLRDYRWRDHIQRFDQEGEVQIPINPPGWQVDLRRNESSS